MPTTVRVLLAATVSVLPSCCGQVIDGQTQARHNPHLTMHDDVPANRILFVVTANAPNRAACSMLRSNVRLIQHYHPDDMTLVVDNGSPYNNVESSLNNFTSGVLVSPRQSPSRGQTGAWAVAHHLLSARTDSILGFHTPQGDVATGLQLLQRKVGRVVLLQHTTVLRTTLPPRNEGCAASPLSKLIRRDWGVQPRELMQESANGRFSALAAAVGIRCLDPCLDATGKRIRESSAMEWPVVPHAVLDLSRSAFDQLGSRMFASRGQCKCQQSLIQELLWSKLDDGSISLKEMSGSFERFSGVVASWLNHFNNRSTWGCVHPQSARVLKVHGHTLGGGFGATPPGVPLIPPPPAEVRCQA